MKLYLSKLDVAKRQLETALRLFFHSGDPVSIHTLANASYEILTQLCSAQGVKGILEEGIEKFIREEKRKEVRDKMYEAKNFFKHSRKDPHTNIEFNPELSSFFLWDACRLYRILTSEFTPTMLVFHAWFCLKNKEIILIEETRKIIGRLSYINQINLDAKEQFFEIMLPLAEKLSFKV